ncbi:MAG: S8 family serine peptidase [Pseudomonadota bacterium]
MKLRAALSFLLLLALTVDATADPRPRDRLSPGVKILRDLRHLAAPPFRRELIDGDVFVGSIRFVRPPEVAVLEVMEARGVEFLRTNGRRRGLGTIYPARIPFDQLDWLSELPDMVQVATDFLLQPIQPLNVTRPLTGAGTFSEVLEGVIGERPGEGMIIADFDHGIDPFHPGLFKADGGFYPWIDVDGDGQLSPGIDGVDLDGDGSISPLEVLRHFDAAMWNMYDDSQMPFFDGIYHPTLDWLYLDQNENGTREWGAAAGATDQTAAFGEPVFVVDDVNGDGAVDLEEKLVLLRTSKIRAVRVGDLIYERGTNLSALDPEMFNGSWAYDKSGHGTGVTGILVANTPRMTRFVGMAPFAEVILVDSSTGSGSEYGAIERLIWARDQGATLFLHEYSSWGMDHMDGTSNYDQALDSLVLDDNIPQVVPAGNLAGAAKHSLNAAPSGTTGIRFELPTEYPDYPGYPFEIPYLYITLYFAGDPGDVDVSLSIPGLPDPVPLPEDTWQGEKLVGDLFGGMWSSQSPGGFAMITLVIMTEDQVSPLPSGEWTLHLNNQGDGILSVHGFLNDPVTGWSRGPSWMDGLTPDTTLCSPSTASEALSVAAYAGVHDGAEGQGNLRGYSSRGPRMDGAVKLGLAAPDDPYTTLPTMKMPYSDELIHGGYTVFGGTSGAGPHVVGTMALLMQTAKGLTARQATQAMYDGALQTPDMGPLPNKDWGYGKLDVHKAALGTAAVENARPTAIATATDAGGYQVVLDGAGSTDPDGDPITYRWDSDYDGSWDNPQSDLPQAVIQRDGPAKGIAKLRVYDDKGAFSEALVPWEATEVPEKVEPEPSTDVVTPGEDSSVADALVGSDGGGVGDVIAGGGGAKGGGCGVGTTTPAPWFLLLLLLFPARRAVHETFLGMTSI